ncbi:MAG: tetratricopeptide repeat protein [Deltaproteobacteria bacterium]|nr:tetratricopeptide repeat protein [Candidatus Zymogenaceae bacterium]
MDEIDVLLDAARDLIDLNYYTEAMAMLADVIRRFPDEPDAYYLLGCSALNLRMGAEAFGFFSMANELCPDESDILSGMADACLTMDRLDLADTFITRAEQAEAGNINAAISRGHYLERMDLYEEAVEHYRTIMKSDSGNDYLNARMGYCLMNMGMFEEAAKEIAGYLAENPTDSEWHFQLGLCYGNMGMLDEAISTFNYLVRTSPDDPMARAYLALAMADKGWITEAQQEITRALRMDPDNPRVQEIYDDIMGRDEGGASSGNPGDLAGLFALLLILKTISDRSERFRRT